MIRRISLLAAAAAALAVPAAAAEPAPILLGLNDGFVPKATNIVCAVEISKTLVPGARLLDCFIATSRGAVPNTYTVALAVNGEAALGRVDARGKLTVVMKRGGGGHVVRERANGSTGKVYRAEVGSTYIVKGTSITCAVVKQTIGGKSGTAVTCFKLAGSGKAVPNSYGIGITNGNAFLVHFDARSKATPIKIVAHGH
jgi:hypothetical protein